MTRRANTALRTSAIGCAAALLTLWVERPATFSAPDASSPSQSGSVAGIAPRNPLQSPCPGCGFAPEPIDAKDYTGWAQIFDGKSLAGWDGNPEVWKVEDGAITAVSTAERRLGTTYIIWRGGEPADFELKLEIKADSDIHSGVFYRGKVGPNPLRPGAPARGAGGATPPRPQPSFAVPADPKWNVTGYSLDFDYARDNDGNIQDTGGRSETQIVWRGHVVRMEPGKRPRSIGSLGDRDALMEKIVSGDWNALHIIARGNQLTHIVNGQVMAILIDDDPDARKMKGVVALQIEQYGTGKINFRNIWLKQ
jgi:3-keto-disaccharide hydrolase